MDFRRDSQNDIYAQKVNCSGTPQWTANGVAIRTATGTQGNPPLTNSSGSVAPLSCQWDFDNDGDNIIAITLTDGGLGNDDLTANGTIVDQGGPGWPPPSTGTRHAPVFPGIYIGIGSALAAGAVACFVRRRLAGQ